MKIARVIAHIVALVAVDDPGQTFTQFFTTGQVGDDAQSFFVKCSTADAMAQMRAVLS